jgi:predicted dehydrogenase
MDKIKIIIAGAGNRGVGHANQAFNEPNNCEIVGVAEPREDHRNSMADKYEIKEEYIFDDWKAMAAVEKFADAVVISTQDGMHVEPVREFAAKGYDILLEKPMAPDAEGCKEIIDCVKKAGVIFGVCHVLRYTPYTKKLKSIIDSGAIGEIVSIQRTEPVGYFHHAHSYVRGNWRNEEESSCMLLAKSCHDIDWLHYIMGRKCSAVSSFGSLKHFRKECQPEGAADRCVDCSIEKKCPYSAIKIYMGRLKKGETGWPVDVVVHDPTEEKLMEALRTGPYGRCVYACDNDVVDNQVVNMNFDDGSTVSFSMNAFNKAGHRETVIFGTRGQIKGDGDIISVHDFLTDETETIDTNASGSSVTGGHGGGDHGVMKSFVDAVKKHDQSLLLTGADETLHSHLLVFAAEEARVENKVVCV